MKPSMKMLMLADRENYSNNADDRRWTITEGKYMPRDEETQLREYNHYNEQHPSMGSYEIPYSRRYKNGRFAPTKGESDTEIEMRGNYVPSMAYGEKMPHERMQIGFAGSDEYEIMPFSQMSAEKWTREMENEDGSKGPHWNIEQVKMLMGQKGITGDPWKFFAAINAMYSDYSKVLKKHGAGDKLDIYIDMAKAFMDDKDAQPDKLARYYKYIVKH